MFDIQPYYAYEKILVIIGQFLGSVITIAIIFLILIGLNKITLRKKINYFMLSLIVISTSIIIDMLEGCLSGALISRRLFAGILVGFCWERITISIQNKRAVK